MLYTSYIDTILISLECTVGYNARSSPTITLYFLLIVSPSLPVIYFCTCLFVYFFEFASWLSHITTDYILNRAHYLYAMIALAFAEFVQGSTQGTADTITYHHSGYLCPQT